MPEEAWGEGTDTPSLTRRTGISQPAVLSLSKDGPRTPCRGSTELTTGLRTPPTRGASVPSGRSRPGDAAGGAETAPGLNGRPVGRSGTRQPSLASSQIDDRW